MTETKDTEKTISKWWYFGHIFFWFVSGLVCYAIHKKTNRAKAKKHLITSIWLPLAVWVPIHLLPILLVPEILSKIPYN